MRFLVYDWNSLTKENLYQALVAEGIQVDLLQLHGFRATADGYDLAVEETKKALDNKKYDAVFSIDYWDGIATACYEKGIPYISWSYDSPGFGGKIKTHGYETNYVFLFDSNEVQENLEKGDCKNIHFINLAITPPPITLLKCSKTEKEKYQSEISFVGQLYLSEMEAVMANLNPYKASYVNALINIQLQNYNVNLLKKVITTGVSSSVLNDEIENIIKQKTKLNIIGDKDGEKCFVFRNFLCRATTSRERVILLEMLSKRHHVKLFSGDTHDMLSNVIYSGKVNYATEMPKVFYNSKINLNITLRSIETGIPQRCLDILGCRGFLLTNEQKDLYTELEDRKDIVVYHSLEEAVDLAEYYLKHEKEREKIAQNGFIKAKECFSYHKQLDKILKISGLRG